jgi:hypothetical protein
MSEPLWKTRDEGGQSKSTSGSTLGAGGGGAQVCKGPSKKDAMVLSFEEGDRLRRPDAGGRPLEPGKIKQGASNAEGVGEELADAPREQESAPEECVGVGDPLLDVFRAKSNASAALVSLTQEAWVSLDSLREAQGTAWDEVMTIIAPSPEMVLNESEYHSFMQDMAGVKGQGAIARDALVAVTEAGVSDGANRLIGHTLTAMGRGKSLGAAFARELSIGLGGFVVGIAGGVALAALMALLSKSKAREVADVSRAAVKAAQAARAAVEGSAGQARGRWLEKITSLDSEIQASGDVAALDALTSWIGHLKTQLPKNIEPKVLKHHLLELWTLQHAGDEESANQTTNEESWKDAATALDEEDGPQAVARGSKWKRDDGDIQKPDLFRDQLTLAMGRAGLDTSPLFAAVEQGRKRVVSTPGSRRPQAPVLVKYDKAADDKKWSAYAGNRWPGFHHTLGDRSQLSPHVEVSVVLATNEGGTTVWVDKLSFLVSNKVQQRLAWWDEGP